MKMAILVLWTLCFVTGSTLAAQILPPPPSGYSWVKMDEINGAFLKPAGWHFAYNKGKLLGSFSMLQHAPQIGRPVGARFIVYAVSNLSKIDSKLVSERIPQYVQSLKEHKDYDLTSSENLIRGSYRGMSVRYQFESHDESLVRQQIYLANDQADLLLVIIFESSEGEWEQVWKKGRVLMDNFVLG